MIETTDLTSLSDKTCFLRLNFGRFGVTRKVDIGIQSEAVESRFTHQKKLLVSPELKAIAKADNEIKAQIDAICLPYDVGIRFAPIAAIEQIDKILSDYAKTRPALVDAFLNVYETQIKESELELKEQFDGKDYPLAHEVEAHFTFTYQFISFSVPGHLKSVAPGVFAAEKEKAHEMLMEAAAGIGQALATTAHELVANLLDRLTPDADGKSKKLYAVHVTKLQEFLNTFDLRNVTDSKELQIEMDKLKAIMSGVDVEKIKNSETLRLGLQSQFKEVTQSIGALVEVKGRKFRDLPEVEVQ
jgi:hypothetical protein